MYQSRVLFWKGRERFLSAANCLTIIFSRRLVGITPEDKSIVRVQVPARYSVRLANEPATKWSNSQRTYKNSRRGSSKKATNTKPTGNAGLCCSHVARLPFSSRPPRYSTGRKSIFESLCIPVHMTGPFKFWCLYHSHCKRREIFWPKPLFRVYGNTELIKFGLHIFVASENHRCFVKHRKKCPLSPVYWGFSTWFVVIDQR